MYFTQAFGGTFYVTWLPTYLASRGLTGMTAGILAGLPLILSAAADLLGGVATDRTARRLGLRLGRSIIGGGALAAAGLFTIAGTFVGVAGGGGGADCARRRLVEFSARGGVGNVPRHRRPPCGRGERGDEYIRAGRERSSARFSSPPSWRSFRIGARRSIWPACCSCSVRSAGCGSIPPSRFLNEDRW